MSPATRLGSWSVLRHIRVVEDEAAERALIDELATAAGPHIVSFVNQNGFNLACEQPRFLSHLAGSDVLLRDGVGMEFCLQLLGLGPGRNMNGTDFIPKLLGALGGRRLLLIGSREPWLGLAAERLRAHGSGPVATRDGYRPAERYLDDVRALRPEIVILAMGSPLQEELAVRLRSLPEAPRLIVNAGAFLDFVGGRFPRAPNWLRAARLEWLFRLAHEPRRLGGRYLLGGPVFLARIASLRLSAPTHPSHGRPKRKALARSISRFD